jgi:hypothetical protein
MQLDTEKFIMQLDTLSFYIDVRQNYMDEKDYIVKINSDGFLEYKEKNEDRQSKILVLIYKDFHVSIYAFKDEDFRKYKEALIAFKKFFDTIDHQLITSFCKNSCFNFSIGIFNESAHRSNQIDIFRKLYKKWWFLEFDYSFDNLNSIKEFNEFLEINCCYKVYDKDWPQIKIFIKNITKNTINNVFKIIELSIKYENHLTKKMNDTKAREYKKQKDNWKKEIANFL